MKSVHLDTKLGPMVAIADDVSLYLLEFADRPGLDVEIESLKKKLNVSVTSGKTPILDSIESELANYFDGKKFEFKTPVHFNGSSFQNNVWNELRKIPYGETRSYLDIAKSLKKPTAFRAVAQANASNQLVIIVPCHRVINHNGKLGGYAGGVDRKQRLLELETQLTA